MIPIRFRLASLFAALALTGCGSLPVETGSIDFGPNPESVASAKSESASTQVAANGQAQQASDFAVDFSPPPDSMSPGKHYQARLASESSGSGVVHGEFVRFEGPVEDRVAVFKDGAIEHPYRRSSGAPMLKKVPYVNRLFKNTGYGVDWEPFVGEKRVPLGAIANVTQVAPEQAVKTVENQSVDAPQLVNVTTRVARGDEVLYERIGIDFDTRATPPSQK